ncbi:MAG: hypothetical protein AB8I08_09925 [Sandaracinaceae bacterium]
MRYLLVGASLVLVLGSAHAADAQSARRSSWWPALPERTPLNGSPDEIERRAQPCIDLARGPEAGQAERIAAADCFAAMGFTERELRLRERVFESQMDSGEWRRWVENLRVLAIRYEQLGRLRDAMRALEELLDRFPSQDAGSAAGRRAVCIARALGAAADEGRLRRSLSRLYRRSGSLPESEEELAERCQRGLRRRASP